MNEKWHLTVWGVRGSFPTPEAEYLEYGGNTSCLSVLCGRELIIFDAGSGLASLGKALVRGQYGNRNKRIHLFLSHFHLDHVMGLFLFQPFHDPDAEIHLYGAADSSNTFRERLEAVLGQPLWPLGIREFPADIHFHQIAPDTCFSPARTDLTVRTMNGNHPGGSLYYRLEDETHSLVYALDCELEEQFTSALADFARNAGLLIWDANFTSRDMIKGWGHSTWEQGLAFGLAADVGKVLMTHYSGEYTDSFLQAQELLAQAYASGRQAQTGTTASPEKQIRTDMTGPAEKQIRTGMNGPAEIYAARDQIQSAQPQTICCFARERMEIIL